MLHKALKNVIEVQGGIDQFSLQAKQCYQQIDRTLSEGEEIKFYSLINLLNALGLQISVTVKSV